jgi:hypothetical protein
LPNHHWDSPKQSLSFCQYHQPSQKEKAIRLKAEVTRNPALICRTKDMRAGGAIGVTRRFLPNRPLSGRK